MWGRIRVGQLKWRQVWCIGVGPTTHFTFKHIKTLKIEWGLQFRAATLGDCKEVSPAHWGVFLARSRVCGCTELV